MRYKTRIRNTINKGDNLKELREDLTDEIIDSISEDYRYANADYEIDVRIQKVGQSQEKQVRE